MLDWDDLRFFLAVARHRTMSGAARALQVAQPTVGRRIAAFEQRLGARLFLRASGGWTPSTAGVAVLAHAEAMEQQALAAENAAAGRDAGLEGAVRLTASEWMTTAVLGPRLGPLLTRHPLLSVEVLADPRQLNLFRREADIAIRPSRFQQQEVVQREIAVIQYGLYASEDYLARRGPPDFASRGQGHLLVAAGEPMGTTLVDREWLPPMVGAARVAVRASDRMAMATIAASGLGITCLPRFVGDATPGLRLLPTPRPRPRRQLWLGVHRAARTVRRVKAVSDFIAASVEGLRPALDPAP